MKRFGLLVLIWLAGLGATWLLVQSDSTRMFFVPDPENVVSGFMTQLSGGRYDLALEALDDSLRSEMGAEGLKELDEALQERSGQYSLSPGGPIEIRDTRATYEADVETARDVATHKIEFELERNPDTNLWEISSLDDLKAQAKQQYIKLLAGCSENHAVKPGPVLARSTGLGPAREGWCQNARQ